MFNSYRQNTLQYAESACINCGMCLVVCPQDVFRPGKKAVQLAYPARCMECGACQLNCPVGALLVDSGTGCASAMFGALLRGKKIDEKEACT